MKKIKFIINPKSGLPKNLKLLERWIDEILAGADIPFDIYYTQKPGEATELAREAVLQNYSIVAAVGGDGTINETASGLVNSDSALAIIPAGSGNGMAHNLKIPVNKKEALKLLIEPTVVKLDVGQINDHYFFNVTGFGMDSEIIHNHEKFGIRGPLSYFIVGTSTFFKFKPQPVTIKFNDQEIKSSPLVVTIANSPEYGVGAIIAPRAVPNDGWLDLIILDPFSIWKALLNLYRLFNGKIADIKEYHHYRVKTVEIFREEPGNIEIDGNPHFEDKNLKIKILPQQIDVVVGSNFIRSQSAPDRVD
jgi:YegS/Rv2252/BmrU family lipid kinase